MALPTRRDNEGSSRPSEVEASVSGFPKTVPLTVKLNGRQEGQRARQSDSTLKAHQAPSHAEFHGPFQRLLERTHRAYCARAAFSRATRRRGYQIKRAACLKQRRPGPLSGQFPQLPSSTKPTYSRSPKPLTPVTPRCLHQSRCGARSESKRSHLLRPERAHRVAAKRSLRRGGP